MTSKQATKLGYRVIAASPFEVGLTKNGKGVRTWFCQELDRKIPSLDHPEIKRAITINEEMEQKYGNTTRTD